jgi:protein-disulfide isomerase
MTYASSVRTALALGFALSFCGQISMAQQSSVPETQSQTSARTATAQSSTPAPEQKLEALAGTFEEIKGDHTLGSTDAPVDMIIYASVTCPHCASWFASVWPGLKRNYVETGQVRVIFRELPTAPAQLAMAGFQIANCAPDDQYFTVIEHLMKEQQNTMQAVRDGKGVEIFLSHAKLAGIDNEDDMNACFNNAEGTAHIQLSSMLANAGGITSVPGFIINGNPFKGQPEYIEMSKHFQTLLNQSFTPLPKDP